jgi:hypothetical protein
MTYMSLQIIYFPANPFARDYRYLESLGLGAIGGLVDLRTPSGYIQPASTRQMIFRYGNSDLAFRSLQLNPIR